MSRSALCSLPAHRYPGRGFVTATASRDQKYYLLMFFPDRAHATMLSNIQVPRETWWMLGIFAVLCYILARRLTSPLRAMQKTIERFGKGDFTARVNSAAPMNSDNWAAP